LSEELFIPVVLVREYYWCPVSAFYKLVAWDERPSESMAAGAELVPRDKVLGAVEERHELREVLWEYPVRSRRLGVAGRVDLVAVTEAGGLVVVDVKLPKLTGRGLWARGRRWAVQLAAYAVAAEETLGLPLEAAYLYSIEAEALVEVRIGPQLRGLVEDAVRQLRKALEKGEPPRAQLGRRKCSTCSYNSICGFRRG
jgi:CRISPR-associated exonuclease Cas4